MSGMTASDCDKLCGVAGVHSACEHGALSNSRLSTYLAIANLWDIDLKKYIQLAHQKQLQ